MALPNHDRAFRAGVNFLTAMANDGLSTREVFNVLVGVLAAVVEHEFGLSAKKYVIEVLNPDGLQQMKGTQQWRS